MPSTQKIILEDTWEFKPDRTKIVESKIGTLTSKRIPGVLSKCDFENGNNRVYPRSVWEANLKEGSHLQDLIRRNASFGLLEHPESGVVTLEDDISHLVSKVELLPDGTVVGEITILEDLPAGKKLLALIENGYDPLVSSRGCGTIVRENYNGKLLDVVQNDFVCSGWDVVSTPSFRMAQLVPSRATNQESLVHRPASVVDESNRGPESGPTANRATVTTMEHINKLRDSIAALRGVSILAATSTVVTESFARAEALHRSIAEAQSADPKAAWDCTRMHEELRGIEQGWVASIQSVVQENTTLKTQNKNLVALAENLAKTARLYREQLSKTYGSKKNLAEYAAKLLQKGRGWYKVATESQAKVAISEHSAKVAHLALRKVAENLVQTENGERKDAPVSEALDILARKHVTETRQLAQDNLALSVRVVELSNPGLSEDVKKRLSEAKTVEDVAAISEELKGGATTTPTTATESAATTTAPKPIVESAPKAPAPAPVTESSVVIRQPVLGHYATPTQAIDIARRLSTSAK